MRNMLEQRFFGSRAVTPASEPLPSIDLVAGLADTPNDLVAWRNTLVHLRASKARLDIPETLIGVPEHLSDGELCLIKGEILLLLGRTREAAQFLRFAPSLSGTRTREVDLTLRAASVDPEFAELVSRGDLCRDARDWSGGEHCYWLALEIYPLHYGYMTQYAHCLKEQGKFSDAEVHYRSALALGAPVQDLSVHIGFVAAQDGYEGMISDDAPQADIASHGMDTKPTHLDIVAIFFLLFGSKPEIREDIVPLMRQAKSIRDIFSNLIAQPRFSTVNRQLLYVLNTTDRL